MIGRPSVTLTPVSNASSFIGRVTLVVVHAHDRVVAVAVDGLEEHGVGRMRSAGVDPRRRAPLDRRRDVLGVLVAEQPVLAGVRVEPADRDPRDVEEPSQRRVGQLDHVEHTIVADPVDRLAQASSACSHG